MIDFEYFVKKATGKLIEFRSRYSKNEYPRKIGMNVVYMLGIVEELISYSEAILSNNDIFENHNRNLDSALSEIDNMTSIIMLKVREEVETKFEKGDSLMHIELSTIRKDVNLALTDPTRLENLEFSYVYYSCFKESIVYWIAFRLLRESKISAFSKVFNVVPSKEIEDPKNYMSFFEGTIKSVVPQYYVPLKSF